MGQQLLTRAIQPSPFSGGKLPEGSVGVGRPLAVGVKLVSEKTGDFIKEPAGLIHFRFQICDLRIGVDLVCATVGVHGDHTTGGVVVVGDGVGRAPGGDRPPGGIIRRVDGGRR